MSDFLIVERSVATPTYQKQRHTILPEFKVSDQNTVMEDPSNEAPSVKWGLVSGSLLRQGSALVQRKWSTEYVCTWKPGSSEAEFPC